MAAGEVVKGVDPNDAKREAKRQQLAEKQATTLATLIIEDGPYETSLTGRLTGNRQCRRCDAVSRITSISPSPS